MFNPIPENFHLRKYGLTVRLVNEGDTDYILSLRTNKSLTEYIHQTENDVIKQLAWFHEYKIRENEGRDYYFIYLKDGKPVGLNRIYNIYEYYGTPGSWLCSPENDPLITLSTYFFAREIFFQNLGLDLLVYDVRKANKKVCRLHKMLGAKQIGESDLDYYFAMNKKDYYLRKGKVVEMLGLVE